MLDKPWIYCIYSKKQARYHPITNCTYWPVLVSFKNWNIIQLSQKSTPFEAFEEINQVVLNRRSDNISSLVPSGKYGDIDTYDIITNRNYVIISEAYTLQNNTTTDKKRLLLVN